VAKWLLSLPRGGVDLVITDLIMPGVDGSRLIEEIKNLSPQTPAVLISGRAKIYERETLADVFLCKECTSPWIWLETHSPVANPQARPQATGRAPRSCGGRGACERGVSGIIEAFSHESLNH